MSREALLAYEGARKNQLQRNEARHIRTRVHEAREEPHDAAVRWPFELLQNALDAGPRPGRQSVAITVRRNDSTIEFEHDGAPFSSEELAALLSGGSSKEFGSDDDKTGRFGTGFLVTHVLAARTSLLGVLAVDGRFERFTLDLDRGGDEDDILRNIEECNAAIEEAELLVNYDLSASARFAYPVESDSTLATGLDAFRASLPYLYGTRPALGIVSFFDHVEASETWTAGEPTMTDIGDALLVERSITVSSAGDTRELKILRFSTSQSACSAALVLIEQVGAAWEVVTPGPVHPRMYCQYPLRASTFVPVEFILDGRFEPDQERSRALMNDADRDLVTDALTAAVSAARLASDRGWANAHLLSRATPGGAFNTNDPAEADWWRSALSSFARGLARLTIVLTTYGLLPTLSDDGPYADFIDPRLLTASTSDETEIARLWPLFRDATDLYPPTEPLAEDWSRIAIGWRDLGLAPNLVTVKALGDYARGEASTAPELDVETDPLDWIARFIDIVGECWTRRSGIELGVVEKLIPNQNGRLCSPRDLRVDGGVPTRLKDICAEAGLDVRDGLLSQELCDLLDTNDLAHARKAVATVITTIASVDHVVSELVGRLNEVLPPDGDCNVENIGAQQAVARLLQFLWDAHASDAAATAKRVPLITSGSKAAQWTSLMMAPVSAWHESARAFSEAYPIDRILGDVYLDTEPEVVPALEVWGIASGDPLRRSAPPALEGRRLAEMVLNDFDSEGITIRGEEFSEIALLSNQVINHVQDVEQGRALLGLVLCHAAPHDPAWSDRRVVKGFRARDEIEVPIRGALWIGDLRSRAWVPVRGEDDKPAKAAADVSTLKPLLQREWLEGNDRAIALLTECFGFDELELRLLGIDPENQGRVRQGLARLLESGGGDPAFYEALAQEVEARKQRGRDVERARRMGYAVQEAVRLALTKRGLSVVLVDHGFDYEVSLPHDDVLADGALRFEVGPYWVEVKATSTGSARLTPTQAQTASENAARYVLCVVDLRSISQDRLDEEWTALDVEPLVHLLGSIGGRVVETWELIREARRQPVGIRNDAVLRYEVPPLVWESGVSIDGWIASIVPTIADE